MFQSGFWVIRCAETALVKAVTDMIINPDSNIRLALLKVDLSVDFDTVDE